VFASIKKKISDFTDRVRGDVVLDEKKLNKILFDFQTSLLESDVALEVCEELIQRLKRNLKGEKIRRKEIKKIVKESLKKSILEVFPDREDITELIKKSQKPFVIAFVGVNGTGKTTCIAKIAHLLKKEGLKCVFAASDTFRAGAMEQLEIHAKKLNIKMIKHSKGADPAAVAFDAINHAKAHGKDVVLIDTAGRMETDQNLLEEMRKIIRVSKADLTLFIGDALTGNAAVHQAQMFNDAVPLDGIILAKADADAKGGCAISIAHAIKKPIFFLGTGQRYEDLIEFDPNWFVEEILSNSGG
jgi:fused signal recognition particle receptor